MRRTRTGVTRRGDRPIGEVAAVEPAVGAATASEELVIDRPERMVPLEGDAADPDRRDDPDPIDQAVVEGEAQSMVGAGSLAGLFAADVVASGPRGVGVVDLRDARDRPAAASRAPLVVAVPRPRRRKRVIAGALAAAAAVVGVGVFLGSRRNADDVASSPTTTPEVLAAAATPTVASTIASTIASSVATTATPTATAVSPATTAAPTTSAAPATTAAPAAATAPVVLPAPAGDELPDIYTPVRWAVFQGGRVELLGRVPSQAIADLIATKATAVVGPGNVDVRYIIDPTAPLPASAPLYVRDTIQFGPGSAAVAPQFKPLLDLGVTLMQQNSGVRIWVIGRADNQGDPNANLFLSLDRAQAVIDYIAGTGIDPSRLINVPLGTDAALGDNGTVEGRQQNRSVEFVISGLLS